MVKVIDFHVHLPFRYKDPREAAAYLVSVMEKSGVEKAVVIAVEGGVQSFRRRMSPHRIREAVEEVLDYVAYAGSPAIHRLIFEPEKSIREHEELLLEHRRTTEEVLEASEQYPDRLLPVGSFNPDLGVKKVVEKLNRYKDRLLGVKIYPTLHCISPDSDKLKPLYRWAEVNGKIVIIHTGCDPGMWELPRMCRFARPSLVKNAARRHPGATFIIAHMGAYSMLLPGIFFREALDAAELPNIYLDTSAVDPLFVERAVEEIGPDKILFGSDYPYVTGLTIKDAIDEILELNISESAKRKILYENAARLLQVVNYSPVII